MEQSGLFLHQTSLFVQQPATWEQLRSKKILPVYFAEKNIKRHESLALLLLIHEGNLEAYQYHGLMLGV